MLILTIVPAVLCVFAVICGQSERKTLFNAIFAVSVFTVIGLGTLGGFIDADAHTYSALSLVIDSIPLDMLPMIEASPVYLLIMRLCAAITSEPIVFPLTVAVFQTALAVYAVNTRCREPYHGAVVMMCCFIPVYFAGSAAFTCALCCMIASRYIEERRFFRFAAVIMAAACFDMSALLMIPIYFIMLIPGAVLPTLVSAALAVLAAVFPGAVTAVFGFLGEGLCASAEVTVVCAVIAVIAALAAILMYKMFRNRDGHHEHLVPVLSCGAAFTAAAANDPRLFGISFFLLVQSAVVLAPEAYEIGSRFVSILFPDEKKTAERVFLSVSGAICIGICLYLVLTNAFGSDVYEDAFGTGVWR